MSSISSIGATEANYQSAAYQRIQNWKSLASALQSGDLAAAQKAFASIQNDKSKNLQAVSSDDSKISLKNDLKSLSDALQSGDVTSAQKAFATLQQDMQTLRTQLAGHRHHHHHHTDSDSSTDTSTTDATIPSDTTSDEVSQPGSLLNAVA